MMIKTYIARLNKKKAFQPLFYSPAINFSKSSTDKMPCFCFTISPFLNTIVTGIDIT